MQSQVPGQGTETLIQNTQAPDLRCRLQGIGETYLNTGSSRVSGFRIRAPAARVVVPRPE